MKRAKPGNLKKKKKKKGNVLPDMGALQREAALLFCYSAQGGNTVYKVLISHIG
jgi:hypothetical protein